MISWIGLTYRRPTSQAEEEDEEEEEKEDTSEGVMPIFIMYPWNVGVDTFDPLLSPTAPEWSPGEALTPKTIDAKQKNAVDK